MTYTRTLLILTAGLLLAGCSSTPDEPAPVPSSSTSSSTANVEPAAAPADAEPPETVEAMCAELLPMFDAVRDLPGYDAAAEAEKFLSHTAGSGELDEAGEARMREAVQRAAAGEC